MTELKQQVSAEEARRQSEKAAERAKKQQLKVGRARAAGR